MVADFVDSVDQAARRASARAGARLPHPAASSSRRSPRSRARSRPCATRSIPAATCSTGEPGAETHPQRAAPESGRSCAARSSNTRAARGSKYLQDEVITERNGRFVLMVRAEHRGNVPGIVHGSSTTGATLFMEPAATVEINNDIVELEDREREEIFRILLELTDRFRARPEDMTVSREVARELDVLQAKARYSSKVNGIEPEFTIDTSLQLKAARHPMLEHAVPVDVLLDPPNRVLLITGPEHRRQDRRDQDGRVVRADGASRPASAGHGREDCRCSEACLPTSATSSRSKPASARSRRTSRIWSRWIASCSCRRWSSSTRSARAPIPTKAARSRRRSSSTSASAARLSLRRRILTR